MDPPVAVGRLAAPLPEGEYGATKQQVLPDRNAAWTPAFTAASTLSNCCRLQYSSWPTDRNAFARVRHFTSAWTSLLEQYVTS